MGKVTFGTIMTLEMAIDGKYVKKVQFEKDCESWVWKRVRLRLATKKSGEKRHMEMRFDAKCVVMLQIGVNKGS